MKQPVTLVLGTDVRAGLDHFAAAQDRSRSWVANHAIKQFLEQQRTTSGQQGQPSGDLQARMAHAPHGG